MGTRIEFGYRPDLLQSSLSTWLDHFRWIAALMVAASHLRNLLLPDADQLGQLGVLERLFYFVTLFATQSVVVFFVLSGLLVGGVILRAGNSGAFDLRKFGVNRAARLYVALIPTVALAVVLQHTLGATSCRVPDPVSTVTANLLYLQNFSHEPICNDHPLWSLSSEAYFYLIGPFLILGIMRRSWRLLAVTCLLAIPALVYFQASYVNPLFGLGLWLVGLLPWVLRIRVHWIIMAIPVVVLLLLGRFHFFAFRTAEEGLLALAFALFLCSDIVDAKPVARRAAASLAAFSYSLYLVHMPIGQAFAFHLGWQGLPNGQISSYVIYFAILGLIVLIGWMFGRLFEARTPQMRKLLDCIVGAVSGRFRAEGRVGEAVKQGD